jgi:hypothetical protein
MTDEHLIDLDLESNVSSKEFIGDVYEIVRSKAKRAEIFTSDFYFEMIPRMGKDVWWMAVDHPVALMFAQNNHDFVGDFNGPLGRVVVHSGKDVDQCIDAIIRYCDDFQLPVTKNGGV